MTIHQKKAAAFALSALLFGGCKAGAGGATYSNSDGQFALSPDGTFTQTLPQTPVPRGKTKQIIPLDTLTNTGTWHLIGPTDGPLTSGYRVELSGVRRHNALPLVGAYTIVVPLSAIHSGDKLLNKQTEPSSQAVPGV